MTTFQVRSLASVLRGALAAAAALIAVACGGSTSSNVSQRVSPGDPCASSGAHAAASDGCNTCTCTGGVWACTEMACIDAGPGAGGSGAGGAGTGGKVGAGGMAGTGGAFGVCQPGTTMGDGCNTCTCAAGGWACTNRACPPPPVDAGPAPMPCGARAGNTCSAAEYCAYQVGQYCGGADAESVCMPRPQACTLQLDRVCGCDGMTYPTECAANAAGTGVMSKGPCTSASF